MESTVKSVGLKKLRTAGSKRNAEWNKPNHKAQAAHDARVKSYEAACNNPAIPENVRKTFNKPGSMNRRNQTGVFRPRHKK